MAVGNPITELSTTGNFVPVTRTLTINGVSYDLSADRSWSIASPGGGSVTSVAMTVPTGFSVSGSPITSSGTLAVTFASGYALPTTVKQSNWDDAYTFVSNFPSQTGNNGKFLYTSGSVLSWQAALQNPFTVVGQLVYGGVSGAVTVLNGNTSTTTQYLQQTGTGSSSSAPTWGGIISTNISGQALTRVNDTNVTLTLSGITGNSVLNAVEITAGWAGQLAVSRGGTGAATLTGVLIGNGTSAFTAITGGPNQLLRVNGTATGYEFFTASFLTNPMTLNYDMIYQSSGVPARLAGPTSTTKQFLTAQGNGTATTSLAWGTIDATDITAAALTKTDDTNVTLTLGGTPATSLIRAVSLTLGWSGTLAVGRGGSGASTLTGVLIGNGTSAFTAVAGTAGQFLRRNTANTAYEFRTLQGGDIAGSELTFANDTNVTMSLSGTPASALLQPVNITLGWTGQLSVSRGGTGASTLTGVLIGNGTSAVTAITGTANQILRRNSGNTAYEFWTANYMTNPMTLEGSIIYAATGGTPTELFANSTSTRKYLSQINGTAPTWEALPASVSGSGTINYLAKWTPSGTVLGNSQIYDNGLNVGIGMIPTYKLDIEGADLLVQRIRSTTNTGAAVYLAQNDLSNQYEAGIFGSTRTAVGAVASGNAYTGSSTQAFVVFGNLIKFATGSSITEQMRLTNAGDFGIGTQTPNTKLHTTGSLTVNDNIYLQRGSGSLFLPVMNFWNGTGTPLSGTKGDILAIGNTGGDAVVFVTNASERARFTSAGYLGINKTVPVSHLDVAGNININSASYLTWGGAYGTDIPTISGTSGSGSNGFLQFYPAGSTSGVKMALRRTGQLALPSYTSSSAFTGTSVATLAVDAAGDVITIAPQQTTASGTYTPTWTGLANVTSVTAFSCQYMRVGDTVTVSGWVTIDPVVDNTTTSLSFSLPINSDVSVVNRLNGTGVTQGGGAAACLSGYGANFGEFEVVPSLATAVNYSFIFTYRIV